MRRATGTALLVVTLTVAGCGGSRHRAVPLDVRGLGTTPATAVVPRDAIPAIDQPQFDPPQAVRGLLGPGDLVVGVVVDGRPHAYPVELLSFHEIVNDGPIVVTWCPLCQTALAFDRDLRRRRLTFGVSGFLEHSNLVLYDRETGSLWSQLAERAISGRYLGTPLHALPLSEVTWGQWLRIHPNTLVLSIRRDRYASRFTHPFEYFDRGGEELSSDPYFSYNGKVAALHSLDVEGLRGAAIVLGIRIGDVTKAYPLYLLRHPISDVVAGRRLRIVPDRKRGYTFATAVFEDGVRLSATPVYWFAWHAFYPRSLLYSPKR
jgi:hypothetical protein